MSDSNKCVICKVELVHDIIRELAVPRSEIIYGPGGQSQYRTVDHGYHCPVCGIKYKKPPIISDK